MKVSSIFFERFLVGSGRVLSARVGSSPKKDLWQNQSLDCHFFPHFHLEVDAPLMPITSGNRLNFALRKSLWMTESQNSPAFFFKICPATLGTDFPEMDLSRVASFEHLEQFSKKPPEPGGNFNWPTKMLATLGVNLFQNIPNPRAPNLSHKKAA